MACDLQILRQVPLFGLLDDEELAVLAEQVELRVGGIQSPDGGSFERSSIVPTVCRGSASAHIGGCVTAA
jgi:hypothetical protein